MYFDEFKIEHIKSPVVQSDDYYPFGLTYNSYQREDALKNRWKFQGQEHIDDLGLNWDAFKWRNHQPDIGRFFGIDPLSEKYYYNSPYAFSENHVTSHVELEGLEKVNFMVVRFEPNQTEFRSPEQALENPSEEKNTTFENVNPFSAKTAMNFTADLKTGETTNIGGADRDKNPVKTGWDQVVNGDGHKLDYELKVTTTKDGGFSITGKINGVDFTLGGTIDSDNINITSQMQNVPNEDGAYISIADGGVAYRNDQILNAKQGSNCFICGEGNSSLQKSSIPYTVDKNNNAQISITDDNKKLPTIKP